MPSPESLNRPDVLVIGAGLSGLAAAVLLHEAGRSVVVLEAGSAVGGRVRTDEVDGFLLDRGFQVYLDAYPEARRLLDLDALELRPFDSGAFLWRNGKRRLLADAFRHPETLLPSLFAPVGSPLDKLRVLKLRRDLERKSCEAIWSAPERTTADYLRGRGFSDGMIDLFFRGFYGGIFLEEDLATSSRMFEFTFKMFSIGSATLPRKGMGAIPKQLAGRLPEGTIRLRTRVGRINGTQALTTVGKFEASHFVLAVDAEAAASILAPGGGSWQPSETASAPLRWNATTCFYFDATGTERALASRPLIHLRGDRTGLIHHACFPSSVQPSYAPEGGALLCATLLGDHGRGEVGDAVDLQVREELTHWFGPAARDWPLLARYAIPRALPSRFAGHLSEGCRFEDAESNGSRRIAEAPALAAPPRIWRCGDDLTSPSIEGALIAGNRAADRILADREKS